MKDLKKYGKTALVAGASEGIGAAFAEKIAAQGMDLILVARNEAKLKSFANSLSEKYKVKTDCFVCDLASEKEVHDLLEKLNAYTIDLFIYNAALTHIGAFEKSDPMHNRAICVANMISPMQISYTLGEKMVARKRGAIVLMASMAGFQGSGFLSVYGASKAFDRVFAEGLWYEWKNKGVDVIASCAGATSTPNYINSKPKALSFFAPRVQTPDEVADETLTKLGSTPSFICGSGNKMASWFMQKLLPRRKAIEIMGDTTKDMYSL